MSVATRSRFQKKRSGFGAPSGARRRFRWSRLTLITVTVCITLSVVAFFGTRARDRAQRAVEFEEEAIQFGVAGGLRFAMPIEALRSTASFMATVERVDRAKFRAFTEPLLEAFPQLYAIEWMPLVLNENREAHEAAAHEDGFSFYRISERTATGELLPSPERDFYLPLFYMEPPSELALGMDAIATAHGAEVPQRAYHTGEFAASGSFQLVEDAEGIQSLVVYAPVRDIPIVPYTDPVPNPDPFLGLAAIILRIEPTVQLAREIAGDDQLDIAFIDETDTNAVELIYASSESMSERALDPGVRRARIHGPRAPVLWSRDFDFADRNWRVIVAPAPDSDWEHSSVPWIVLVVGLLLAVVITYGVGLLETIFRLRQQVDKALELGQYTLGRKLGEGGMGVVYEAQHKMLARPAAIKLIRPENLANSTLASAKLSTVLGRFESEARATARLQSPHTISIYDYGRTDRGEFYYVMELLIGVDFESLVVRFGPVNPARVVMLLRQACHSLAEAHQEGMVHRDIKPANLYTCRKGLELDFVKILDFGLVKEQQEGGSGQTIEGTIIGTPAYMAPEMVMAKPDIDGRADLYALGCVAYWMLCGQMVFEGETAMGIAAKHVSEDPTPPSKRTETPIPPELERIVLQCLEKKADDRPADAMVLDRMLRDTGLGLEWDEERAARWWETHLPVQAVKASATAPMASPAQRTVIID